MPNYGRHKPNVAKRLRVGKLYSENVCDVPGYSRLIYQKYPSFYRENKENLSAVMSESSYGIEVSVKIRRVGHENLEVL